MSDHPANVDRVFDLAGAICDERASQDDVFELDSIVVVDETSRRQYWDYCWMHITLGMEGRVHRALKKVRERESLDPSALAPWEADALAGAVPLTAAAPSSSAFPFLSTAVPSTIGYFSSGWPIAYLVATVILGIGLLIGSFMPASRPQQIAERLLPVRREQPSTGSKTESVGQITGMVDCKWADPAAMPLGVDVALGRKFSLAAGLMEITYDTGAKVILQGPVTYAVESKNGGFLPVGKLTGKVEVEGAKGFTIRSPTATVTDLGTEFGVEVDALGVMTSHVFRGSIRVQAASDHGQPGGTSQILRENESAQVESRRTQGSNNCIKVLGLTANSVGFIRELPKRTTKMLDLVDVVAGGNGFTGRRGRGIDPATGRIGVQPDNPDAVNAQGDYKYHRVEGVPFVDGVFIPEGGKGPVQIDSAGHTFPDCPKTDNRSYAYVWAGGKLPPIIAARVPATLEGIDYSSSEHSLLFVHANKGITFNLDAIRRDNPGHEVLRFRAMAGNVETESQKGANVSADIWVLVDGQVRFKRREFSSFNGAATVAVPIHASDHFLTLAATDAGNSYMCDQIIFGDPRLELVTVKTAVNDTKRLP